MTAISPAQNPKPDRPWFKKKRFIIPAGVLAFFILAGALAEEEGDSSAVSESKPAATAKETEKPKVEEVAPAKATTDAPKPTAKPKHKPKPKPKPKPLTRAQENAIRTAESYLDYAAFSEPGLIKQLKFEGYSQADAEFAVKRLNPDWLEQAVRAAESYLDYSSFSREGLIEQLMFEGFTREQAEHGVSKTGL